MQQFRTGYIGTGEGAQAYGWGLYFAELHGVAEAYKKSDVQRKQSRAMADWPKWRELKQAAKDEDFLGFASTTDVLSIPRR